MEMIPLSASDLILAAAVAVARQRQVNASLSQPATDTTSDAQFLTERSDAPMIIESDLDLVNEEADRRAGIVRPSRQSSLRKSYSIRSRRGQSTQRPLSCTLSSCAESRPIDLQKCLQLYVVDAVKLLECLIQRGYDEVSTLMIEFINTVMRTFLRNPKNMCDFSPAWLQTKEVLRIICETPTSVDVLCALLTTIQELSLRYLKTRAEDAIQDTEFISYAVNQMCDLSNHINQRMQQCQRRKAYGLLF
ncbi:unnamed protein product [Strongylus vulgaris]|uniref:Uncharacterized protein n=1 Tax=Strongylus vulgaris TaxID=40348 RepID=A0A3P7L6Z7_STRVU|nr:unnamed protein product [Strongylus vulgaris]